MNFNLERVTLTKLVLPHKRLSLCLILSQTVTSSLVCVREVGGDLMDELLIFSHSSPVVDTYYVTRKGETFGLFLRCFPHLVWRP